MIEESEFDEGIRQKCRLGNNSGYLDEEYEVSKEFPTIGEHYFRIEDPEDILTLQQLQRESRPFQMQQTFQTSSEDFKNKLEGLMGKLDANKPQFAASIPTEKHGFYKLADHYDDESALNAVLEKRKIEELRQKVSKMSLQ